jgi:4-hydroxy-tetrahydrodipicolinate synthase
MDKALEVNDRIFPTVRAFYDSPLFDQHNRMKEALVMLGRLERAVVRPPLVKLTQEEIEKIRHFIDLAGLRAENAYAKVA